MNRSRLNRLRRILDELTSRRDVAGLCVVLQAQSDGTLREAKGTRTFADLGDYTRQSPGSALVIVIPPLSEPEREAPRETPA